MSTEQETRAPTAFPDGYERREEGGQLYGDTADVDLQRFVPRCVTQIHFTGV
jgi:hypothetical protein